MTYTFDSNVLVYGLIEDDKGRRALELIDAAGQGNAALLLFQVLGEFSYVSLRKYRLPASEVARRVDTLRGVMPVEAAIDDDLPGALRLVGEHRIAFWDALLCTTAARVGVRYLLSEDMQDGRRFGDLTVVDPFRPQNAELVERIIRT